MVNEVVEEKNTSSLPVSISVTLIIYSLITPLCEDTGGGNQVIETEDEVISVAFSCSGGLVGATEM